MKMHAIKAPEGTLFLVRETKPQCIRELETSTRCPWSAFRKLGYRVVKVKVEEV